MINEFLKRNQEKILNIDCVGDAMVDQYFSINVNRISPEWPAMVMSSEQDVPVCRPGGAANVAYQFKHFNVNARLHSIPSNENSVFRDHGIACLSTGNGRIPIKRRYLDNGIQVTRHDIESPNCGLQPQEIESIIDELCLGQNGPDVAILSDYNKGFFQSPQKVLQSYKGVKTIVDPKKGPLEKWAGCTIFKPNSLEAKELTGLDDWESQCRYIAQALNCESVVITQGSKQVSGIHKGELFCHKSTPVDANSVVGAGDCFSAFLAMAVGHGFEIPDAVKIADTASSIYVRHRMNRPVCSAELIQDHIILPEYLANRNFKLVMTNGCFDILHQGHIETLKFAKSKADKLVVAVNSDESVRRLKGSSRPIVPLEQRMALIASIRCVDYVCSFDEDTPLETIQKMNPDVLVKGSEYNKDDIVGSKIVSEVYVCPMLSGLSTSNIVKSMTCSSNSCSRT